MSKVTMTNVTVLSKGPCPSIEQLTAAVDISEARCIVGQSIETLMDTLEETVDLHVVTVTEESTGIRTGIVGPFVNEQAADDWVKQIVNPGYTYSIESLLEPWTPPRPTVLILLGAEGFSEAQGMTWLRNATPEETVQLMARVVKRTKVFEGQDENLLWRQAKTDKTGRPYFPAAVLGTAPDKMYEYAQKHIRCKRLGE